MTDLTAQDELEALARLKEDERALDEKLEGARMAVAQIVAEARQSAESLKQESELRLTDETARLQRDAASELEKTLETVRDETQRRSEALRSTALHNREHALAWLLARVTGRDTS
jgi:vacuolar-type H+-ATPase subunit H